jgi:hypothetical protein
MTDATTALIDAISVTFVTFAVESIRSRSWVSATFSGVRHELTFRVEGEGAQDQVDLFLNGLDEAEFDLDGHILADISLISRTVDPERLRVRISLEALTLEEG